MYPPNSTATAFWEYPSQQMFFNAMKRKGWQPQEVDMPAVVGIHNAVNERSGSLSLLWFLCCIDIAFCTNRGAAAIPAAGAGTRSYDGSSCIATAARAAPCCSAFRATRRRYRPRRAFSTGWATLFRLIGTTGWYRCDRVFFFFFFLKVDSAIPLLHGGLLLLALFLWQIDRCGREVRYVIDFYTATPPPGQAAAMFVDVRPALDSLGAAWDRVHMQARWVWSGEWAK